MLVANHVITILSLLPLSLSVILQPALNHFMPQRAAFHELLDRDEKVTARNMRWMPRKRSMGSNGTKRPVIRAGGLELELHRREPRRRELGRRAMGNGSIIDLGTALDTYIVPISIGSPPTTYPLQLDLGSSDILLASTLCGKSCPASLGTDNNPYYDVTKASASFEEVNGNSTSWNASFADGSVASGFVARETVMLGGATVQGHVFGMINATSLTLSDQKISGILGLGFPRLSVLAHTLLVDSDSTTSSSSAIAASTSVSATPAAASSSATASSAYLPPLLESLFGSSQTSYPLIGIVLVPPPTNVSASPTTSTPSSPSSTPRYSSTIGSLTLGGISSLYVSTNSSSGRTVSDIEWWDVIPFGRPVFGQGPANNSGPTGSPPSGAQSNVSGTASVFSTDATAGTRPQESANVSSSDLPSTSEDLSGEEYLYWALDLKNVSMNGTDIGLTSTYASLGIGSIALLDAGSNGIYGPQQDVEKLFSLIPDARQVTTGQWAVPCSRSMTIGFSFGGRYVQLQPSDWMYASVASTSFCLAWPAVAASTGDGIDWQLGTPFLKKVYSIFSYGINGIQAPLVGFLPIPDDTTTSALPTSMADATNATATTTNMTITSQSAYGPTPTQIESLSLTSTAEVDLPNAVLANPTFATPPYAYEISSTLTPGVLQYKGLANASVYTVSQVAIVTAASSSSASTASNSVTSGKASAGSVASNQPSSSGASLGFSLDLTALVVPFGLLGLLLVV